VISYGVSFIMEFREEEKVAYSLHTRWYLSVRGNMDMDVEIESGMASAKESV